MARDTLRSLEDDTEPVKTAAIEQFVVLMGMLADRGLHQLGDPGVTNLDGWLLSPELHEALERQGAAR